jgi:hypothetical protein
LALGKRAIDGRSAVAKALNRWQLELIADLGGQDNISTQQHAIIDLAVKQKFLLDSIDAWLLTQETLITGRKRLPGLIPVVIQRQQLADGLAKYLSMLGLAHGVKTKTLHDLLNAPDESEHDDKHAGNGNGKAEPSKHLKVDDQSFASEPLTVKQGGFKPYANPFYKVPMVMKTGKKFCSDRCRLDGNALRRAKALLRNVDLADIS